MTPISLPLHARYNWPQTRAQRFEQYLAKARVARSIQDCADEGWIDQAEASELIAGLRDSHEMMAEWFLDQHFNPPSS